MWPIPSDYFRSKAEPAMKSTACPVKKAVWNALIEAYNDEYGRELFVAQIAKQHGFKTPAGSYLSNLSKHSGDKTLTALIWYEFHALPHWKHLAASIDVVAFHGTFEQAFAKECEPFLATLGHWRLVGELPLQSTNDLQWNFDLTDRQPSADGRSVGIYLEAAAGSEDLGDNTYGFRKLHIKPRLAGNAADIAMSQAFRVAQPAGNDAFVQLDGSGRYAAFWTIASGKPAALQGFFSPDQVVMTIDPTSGPVEFTARMIASSKDICDQFGNEQPRDVRDAFLQALYAKHVGPRDERSEQITLFEMQYSLRRSSSNR